MDNNKNIEKFLESKLRSSESFKPAEGFMTSLMSRITEESKLAIAESKRDKVAKYIISSFSFMIIAITIFVGIISGSQKQSPIPGKFSIEPTIETTNNYLSQFIDFIQNMFTKILEILGLTYSSHIITIALGLLAAVTLFMLADKFLVKEKLK